MIGEDQGCNCEGDADPKKGSAGHEAPRQRAELCFETEVAPPSTPRLAPRTGRLPPLVVAKAPMSHTTMFTGRADEALWIAMHGSDLPKERHRSMKIRSQLVAPHSITRSLRASYWRNWFARSILVQLKQIWLWLAATSSRQNFNSSKFSPRSSPTGNCGAIRYSSGPGECPSVVQPVSSISCTCGYASPRSLFHKLFNTFVENFSFAAEKFLEQNFPSPILFVLKRVH